MICRVNVSRVEKLLESSKKLPFIVKQHVYVWIQQVERYGVFNVQTLRRYRDHELKGIRQGQRSVILNRQWRLIYTLESSNLMTIVKIEEITPHDYR